MARAAARSQSTLFDGAPSLIETGVLHRDDNLAVLRSLASESVDVVYLDPPFFSNRFYEVIWGEEAEVRSFEDRWAGGIQHYIDWMELRAAELHRVLKPTGSLFLHCDPHASHYLKVMLDGLFGIPNFANEIIWRRTGSHGKVRRFGPIHDVILYYRKTNKAKWNPVIKPYMRGHVEEYFIKDERGWRTNYYGNVLTGHGTRNGESGKPWRGIDPTAKGRHWAIPGKLIEDLPDEDFSGMTQHEKLDRLFELGFIKIDKDSYWPMYERYVKSNEGTPAPDIWAFQPYTEGTVFATDQGIDADVRWLSPKDRERLGYPTQKPEALLERIIQATSDPDDIVLDPFCGCGTTVAVAERLHRRWVGIDISATAVEIMRRRLLKLGRSPRIENAVDSVADLRELKPFEFQNWIINAVYGTHSPRKVGDMGIDGYWFFTRDPIQVKQSEKVGRNVVDNFETAVRRAGHTTGYVIAFSFTRGAVEEAARARDDGLDIKLLRVAEVLLMVKRPHGKFGPQPASVAELPLPAMRKKKDLPSPEELIASDQSASA